MPATKCYLSVKFNALNKFIHRLLTLTLMRHCFKDFQVEYAITMFIHDTKYILQCIRPQGSKTDNNKPGKICELGNID